MANATFDALTGDSGSRSRGARSKRLRRQPGDAVVPRASDVRARGQVLDELRRWLAASNALLEGPFEIQHTGSVVLEMLDRFVPSRQSALLLAEEGSETLVVGAARGATMTLSQATWVEHTARESLARAQVLGRELPDSALSSFLWVPVLSEGRRIGVIELGDSGGRWLAGTTARELSVVADEIGELLVGLAALEERDVAIAGLEGKLESQIRESKEQQRLLSASSSRDAVADFAIRIAEQTIDPSTYVLSNLQTAREDVAAMHRILEGFVRVSEDLLRRRGEDEAKKQDLSALEEVLAAAKDNEFQSCFGELDPLIEDVEQGAQALRAIGEDLRELALGDSAPIDWVDASQLIEQAIDVVTQREGQRLDLALRVETLPPIRCQRLRLVTLLVSLLDHVVDKAVPDSSVGISAESRGSNAVIEVFIEGDRRLHQGDDGDPFGIPAETLRFHREIVEDHGGRIETQVIDDLALVRVSIPTDRD